MAMNGFNTSSLWIRMMQVNRHMNTGGRMNMGIKYYATNIYVKDIGTTKQFYREVLQQTIEEDYGSYVCFANGLAFKQKPELLQEEEPGSTGELSPGSVKPVEITFRVAEPDQLALRLEQLRIPVLEPLTVLASGQKIIRFIDPDGNIITSEENMEDVVLRLCEEGVPVEEIIVRTIMPADFVYTVLKII